MSAHTNRLTFLSVPKAFSGHIGVIQRNAIRSWLQVEPRPDILLFGCASGVQSVCEEWGLIHVPEVALNAEGTPLLSSVFALVQQRAQAGTVIYVNADIIFLDGLLPVIDAVRARFPDGGLVIGRRTNLDDAHLIDFADSQWAHDLRRLTQERGRPAARVCKDYMIFTRPLFANVPALAVGRSYFDNWIVAEAHRLGWPVIDASASIDAIHQNHDHAHVQGGKAGVYVSGCEARRNKDLAGGAHLIAGSATTWSISPAGIKPRRPANRWLQFAGDLPRFLGLLLSIVRSDSGPEQHATPAKIDEA